MRILTNSEGYVDLQAPIYMGEGYRKKFIEFLKNMFPGEIEVENVKKVL